MQQRFDTAKAPSGQALGGASVTVLTSAGAMATLYSDNGVTVKGNPVTANPQGEYSYYAANGRYSESIAATGFTTETNSDAVLLYDPADATYATVKSYGSDAASINAALAAIAGTGRTIFLPGGTYSCNAQIVMDRCRMLGDGATLQFTGLGAGVDGLVLQGANALARLEVCGVTIDMNSVGRDGVSIVGGNAGYTSGCDWPRIRDCYVKGVVRDGLHIEPGAANYWIQNLRIQDLKILSPGRHGIAMIAPALANIFINQGQFDNVDIRGAGQTTAGSYDVYAECQGSTSSQKIGEHTFTSCDFDAAGAANHAQGSICFSLTGSAGGMGTWTFINFTPEDTGSVIAGFPNIIQVVGSPSINGVFRIGGQTTKYNVLIDLSKASRVFNLDGTSNRHQMMFDMGSPGFSASYANDAAAAAAGIQIGQLYRTASAVAVRVT